MKRNRLFLIGPMALLLGALVGAQTSLVSDVRRAIAADDYAAAEALIATHRAAAGVTPASLEALSWLGRGALAAGRLEDANRYAQQTHTLVLEALKTRGVDDEPQLPIALGAAIEVQAQVAAARGERSVAVDFLRRELQRYETTSMQKRIQKNINLLSLEGERPPALDLSEYLGPKPAPLADLRGRVVVLFFWAHWCSDCKIQGPILNELLDQYGPQGLAVVAPTQRFGYVAGGKPAGPAEELAHITEVRSTHYAFLADRPVPLSEANHQIYGVSSTPTMVIVGRDGRIALYHPGRMTKPDLEAVVRRLLALPVAAAN
ncbi:MAG: TlpA family protein disulfide reductase [Vicinamibacterales bacterium]